MSHTLPWDSPKFDYAALWLKEILYCDGNDLNDIMFDRYHLNNLDEETKARYLNDIQFYQDNNEEGYRYFEGRVKFVKKTIIYNN